VPQPPWPEPATAVQLGIFDRGGGARPL